MTLENLYCLAGIITGFGVIVSLIFLGLQVREQVREYRLAANFAASAEIRNYLSLLIENPDLMELYARGLTEFSTLSQTETMRLRAWVGSQIRLFEALYYQNRDGRLEDWLWSSFERALLPAISNPVFDECWKIANDAFTEEFKNFVDSIPKSSEADLIRKFGQRESG